MENLKPDMENLKNNAGVSHLWIQIHRLVLGAVAHMTCVCIMMTTCATWLTCVKDHEWLDVPSLETYTPYMNHELASLKTYTPYKNHELSSLETYTPYMNHKISFLETYTPYMNHELSSPKTYTPYMNHEWLTCVTWLVAYLMRARSVSLCTRQKSIQLCDTTNFPSLLCLADTLSICAEYLRFRD